MMNTKSKRVLVLGAYGLVGCKVVKGLLEKTLLNVLATGRNKERLNLLKSTNDSERLTVEVLDAFDMEALRETCKTIDLVINCVGPYSMGGIDILKNVLQAEKPYIDMANEQVHYERIHQLKEEINRKDLMVVTAAGQTPGISTIVMLHLGKKFPDITDLEMYGMQGRMVDGHSGIASFMGGFLEPSFGSKSYVNGEYIVEPLGKVIKKEQMPTGIFKMLSAPIIDSIILPKKLSLKTIRTNYYIGVNPPRIFFFVLKILKPHKRKWAYNLLEKLVRKNIRKVYNDGIKKGLSTNGVMKFVAKNKSFSWQGVIRFEEAPTQSSYLPVLIAKKYLEDRMVLRGFLTPDDIFDYNTLNIELDKIGWKVKLEEFTPNQ